MLRSTLLPITASALLASAALAQVSYDSNIGAAQNPTHNDSILPGLPLGFTFTFPGGTAVTSIDVDTNGRILPPGGDTTDYSESLAEFLGEGPSICPYWVDLDSIDPTLAAGNIYFNSTATKATITWQDNILWSIPGKFTVQCQLFADGRIAFVYDNRTPTGATPGDGPFVGVTQGFAVDPGGVDLSTGPSTAGVTTIYEDFAAFDLQDTAVEFVPDGSGGWNVNLYTPSGAPPGAGIRRIGNSCATTIDFLPDGSGGYFVTRGAGNWFDDSALGTELANIPGSPLGDDSVTARQALGFTFMMPGAVPTIDVAMDNNGRVISGTDGGDFDSSVADLLNDPTPALVPFWCDLSSQLGSLRFYADPSGTFASITWENVPQFADATTSHTFQVIMRSDSSFSFNYLDTTRWGTFSGATSDDVLVGCSPGNGVADPGASDFGTYPIANVGVPVIYQFWDATNRERPDLQHMLFADSDPVIGTRFDVHLEGLTSATASANILIGFSNPSIDLTGFGIGLDWSTLYCVPAIPAQPATITGSTATFGVNIPNDIGVAGLPLAVQGIDVAPGETVLGAVLTNGLEGVAGL